MRKLEGATKLRVGELLLEVSRRNHILLATHVGRDGQDITVNVDVDVVLVHPGKGHLNAVALIGSISIRVGNVPDIRSRGRTTWSSGQEGRSQKSRRKCSRGAC